MVGNKKKITQILLATAILLIIKACVPLQPTTTGANATVKVNYPKLSYVNTTYSPNIKTVQIAHFNNVQFVSANNPIIELGSTESLILSFDDINAEQALYQAKIIHMNKEWSNKSDLQALDYLNEYNQFSIRDFEYSFDTKLSYVHYSLVLPKVNLSGNYLLVVFRGNNEDDIILSERFMVFENKADIAYELVPSNVVMQRRTHQEIEFNVLLNRINILNTATDIYPVVRQNNNWLLAKKPQDPMRITNQNKLLEYAFFNGELNFQGINEFRFIDLTTVNFKGANVISIDKDKKPITALAGIDGNRSPQAYREWNDRNGAFVIGNRERQTNELVTDYFETTFQLNAPEQANNIYIIGEFNNWEINEKSRMKFNPNIGRYQNQYLLKQGYYEYIYFTEGENNFELDGNYMNTENEYDILIYYANLQLRYDQLIGYTKFNSRAAR
jgi:hypothetical protein